jgi:prepilin signal peptidase PulO-like enzyme (type II secretory pathway)
MAFVFCLGGVLAGFFTLPPEALGIQNSIALFYWCIVGFFCVAIFVYDWLYQEIHDSIVLSGIVFVWIAAFFGIPNSYGVQGNELILQAHSLEQWLLGGWIWYTFLYLLVLIPGWIFALRGKKWSILGEILALYITLLPLVIAELFGKKFKESEDDTEIPLWVGLWDLRIGVFLGWVLWGIGTLWNIMTTYLLGSIIAIGILCLRGRWWKVAFGPFMILWFYVTLIFWRYLFEFLPESLKILFLN